MRIPWWVVSAVLVGFALALGEYQYDLMGLGGLFVLWFAIPLWDRDDD